MNAYIPYSGNAKANIGVSSRIIHTENINTVAALNTTFIDITGAEMLLAISNGEIIYLFDRESQVGYSSLFHIMTFYSYSFNDATSTYTFYFSTGTRQIRFSCTDLNEKLKLIARQ